MFVIYCLLLFVAWILLTVEHRGMPNAGIRLARKSMVYIGHGRRRKKRGERVRRRIYKVCVSAARTARAPFTVTGTGKNPVGCYERFELELAAVFIAVVRWHCNNFLVWRSGTGRTLFCFKKTIFPQKRMFPLESVSCRLRRDHYGC